jgi:hypothetical protein
MNSSSEGGCKLVVDRDLVASPHITVACVDDAEPHPQRAAQSVRDRLRNALDDIISTAATDLLLQARGVEWEATLQERRALVGLQGPHRPHSSLHPCRVQ